MDSAQESELEIYDFGIIFTGRFKSAAEADIALGELEQYLVMERGFSNVRGGVNVLPEDGIENGSTVCPCESPEDCDHRATCIFNS